MRRVATTLLVVLVVCGGAALAVAAGGDQREGKRYRIVFDNAFGLTKGGDLKIGGVRAGETTDFKVSTQRPRKAVVEVELSEPGVGRLTTDASCEIRPQSLIGEYFVDCQPGSSDELLEAGGTIPVKQTSSTIPIDLVNNIVRRPYRERLRLIVSELGAGLAGRGDDLAEVLRRAHPGLRETSRTLRILAEQDRVIQRFIADAEVVTAELEDRKADVTRWVREAGETARITATRRAALRRNFQLLPSFLDELRPYMVRLEDVSNEQIPALRSLQAAAPDLDAFLARLGPFSDASRPAFRGLGTASAAGSDAFAAAQAEVDELRRLARDVPGLAKPLRQLLETLDDRRRAVEIDPRAKATAPPAPDKTAIAGSGGFTGMEALYNYFYWQGLAINGRDEVGHVLKIIGLEDLDCTGYYTTDEREQETFARCNQFMGPDQPGVNGPDPVADNPARASTRSTGPEQRSRERGGADGEQGGDRPAGGDREGGGGEGDGEGGGGGEGAAEDPAAPLPPALRELLDGLPGVPNDVPLPALPQPPGAAPLSDEDSRTLLDYLLAP